MRSRLILFMIFAWGVSHAQENETGIEHNYLYNGYIKDLLTVNVTDDSTLVDNLIHNRLNFQWWPKEYLDIYLEIRTRIFFGDLVRKFSNYSDLIDNNDDFFDLSWTIVDSKDIIIHSMIDRAYIEFHKNDWEISLGRQRINWGVNLVWNPNDLFNAFSYFDFDYEERPGSDAIRIKYYSGWASSIEIASNFNSSFDKLVSSAMWKTNKWGYDFQVLAGKSFQDIAVGFGWAGNIKTAGFKGEVTLFEPYENTVYSTAVLSSISIDYSFENSFYLHASALFNSEGLKEPGLLGLQPLVTQDRITTRNLSPYKWSTFLQASYPVHPLVTTSAAVIFYPGDNALFLNPGVTVNLPKNFDVDLLAQLFFNDTPVSDYEALAKLFFLRIKWSF